MKRLVTDTRATAAIEFALVAPIFVLIIIGLAETVRRSLLMMDTDAAASSGALAALKPRFDHDHIAGIIVAQDSALRTDMNSLFECSGKSVGKYVDKQTGQRANRTRQTAADCAGLPPGRYVQVAAIADAASLFGDLHTQRFRSVAIVRLP